MNKKMLVLMFSLVIAFFMTASSAPAALIDNSDGTITDDDLGIMWLQEPHMAGSNSLTWTEADTWAANLVFATYDDWRLPGGTAPNADPTSTTDDNVYYYNGTGNELGHLFYVELGGDAGWPVDTKCDTFFPFTCPYPNPDPDLALFTELLWPTANSNHFWTSIAGTDQTLPCQGVDGMRWTVNFDTGGAAMQDACAEATVRLSAWAVRDIGDIVPPDDGVVPPDDGVVPVPEPSTILLLGSGLIGLGYFRRKRMRS